MRRDAAKELFQKLDRQYVDTVLLGNEFEGTILEVKRGPGEFGEKLRSSESGPFAIALSGFGNTSGGVLIFGLGTVNRDKLDIIDTVHQIKNLKKFESALRQAETRCVERLIQGVEYRPIEYGEDVGILAIYIPQSIFPPHRTKTDNHFYIRGGDSFVPLDLTLIEDLMYRRVKPDLSLRMEQERENEYDSDFVLTLHNDGDSTVRDPFIVIQLPNNARDTGYEINGNDRLKSWDRTYVFQKQKGHFLTFRNGHSTPIHPKTSIQLLKIRPGHASSGIRYQNGEIHRYDFNFWISADGMPLKEQVCFIEVVDAAPERVLKIIELIKNESNPS